MRFSGSSGEGVRTLAVRVITHTLTIGLDPKILKFNS